MLFYYPRNSDCGVKSWPSSLKLFLSDPKKPENLTGYVGTRWYKAPEQLVRSQGNKELKEELDLEATKKC